MSYYRPLTVDHTKVPSTQTDFPVLVSLSDATLKTVANAGHVQRSDGFDIGFYSDSALTTKLKWEIESYDPVNGIVVAWVKIASLSSASDTVFYMGYGDAAITTDQSDKVSVWSNGFVGVWHLGNGTTLSVADSLNSHNGTNVNTVTAAAGQVDGGGSFVAASTQYITLGTFGATAELTYSAWVKATSFPGAYNNIIGRNSGTIYTVFYVKSNGKLAPAFYQVSSGYTGYDGTGLFTLSTGTWYYVVATYSQAANGKGYVNAVLDNNFTAGGLNSLDTTAIATRIGSDPSTGGREWNGVLDEVRQASVVRSANWITTEYNNQNAPGSFLTLGTEVSSAVDVTVNLTGVAADPQIGTGTVTIGAVVEPPPVTPGGGTGVARTGMRLRPTEDKFVYLKGVAANPQVGQVMVLHEMQRAYEAYSAPIRRAQARKPAEMPPGMRRLFKSVEKPVPPAVFVYQVGLPKLKSAVGTVAVKAFYEDIDEETIAMIDLL